MNAADEVAYRLALAQGFLTESEQDFDLAPWRSCVDNAQLTVENAGKTILASFGVAPKTHDPAKQVAALLRHQSLRENIREQMQRLLPDLLALGTNRAFPGRLRRGSHLYAALGSLHPGVGCGCPGHR